MYAVRTLGHQTLQGIVESDETFFLESDKGKKTIIHRKARKPGGVSKQRGISKEKICVVVAHDRNGQTLSQNTGEGRISAIQLDQVGRHIDTYALLSTYTVTNYKKFALLKGLQHEAINVSKKEYKKKGIYHIQHINGYHKRLKKWMHRFQGVATKCLDNYLFWHRFLELNKKMPTQERVLNMILSSFQKVNFITVNTIREIEKKRLYEPSLIIYFFGDCPDDLSNFSSILSNCSFLFFEERTKIIIAIMIAIGTKSANN